MECLIEIDVYISFKGHRVYRLEREYDRDMAAQYSVTLDESGLNYKTDQDVWRKPIDRALAERILAELENTTINVCPAEACGCDGTTITIKIERGFNRIELSFWEDLPKQWINLSKIFRLCDMESENDTEEWQDGFPYIDKNNTVINPKDGSELILIPAGEFLMGSIEKYGMGNEWGEQYECPQHRVYLNSYYIGKYEVTNAQFARFVGETGYHASCDPVMARFYKSELFKSSPEEPDLSVWNGYYNSETANNPVVCVSWNDAKAYCDWAGLRLPTEAEWEKAARGTDGRIFPWGDEWDTSCCNNSVEQQSGGTTPVGSFPRGASPYGCMDMAGNVREWCNDWYGGNYYRKAPQKNPRGPRRGKNRSVRGGSSEIPLPQLFRTAWRDRGEPAHGGHIVGFRVARSRRIR
jgi:formylglycine-generating enzyme required for sulfatase activity